MDIKRSCDNCFHAVFRDYGYSNYTVEGTTFDCSKGLHPDGQKEDTFVDDPWKLYAVKCRAFKAGDPVRLLVEFDDADLTIDELERLAKVNKGERHEP